jgi:hypothetical protein
MIAKLNRREFISLLGGAAARRPRGRMWGVGSNLVPSIVSVFSEIRQRISRRRKDILGHFLGGLQEFGWSMGRNLRIAYRWVDEEKRSGA